MNKLFKFTLILLFTTSYLHSFSQKIDSLLIELEKTTSFKDKKELYIQLSNAYDDISINASKKWLLKLYSLSVEKDNIKGQFDALRETAIIFNTHGFQDSSLIYLDYIFDRGLVKSSKDSADLYNLKGVNYQYKGDIETALLYLNKALDIYTRSPVSVKGYVAVLTNLGNCFYEIGNADKTLLYHKQAFDYALKHQDTENLPRVMSNYAMMLLYVKNDERKVDSLLRVIKKKEVFVSNPDLLATFYQNLGTFYIHQNKNKEARANYNKALEIASRANYKIHEGIYIGLGMVSSNEAQYKLSVEYYRKALNNTNQNSQLKMIYQNLAEVYQKLNFTDSANIYWNKVLSITENTLNEKIEDLMLQSEVSMDILKKNSEIDVLEKEKEVANLKNKYQFYTIMALVIILMLVLTIVFMILTQKRKQIKLKNEQLNLKNRKLFNLSLQINQKNQLLADFEQQLKSVEVDEQLILRKIKTKLKQALQIDKDWETFEVYLNDLHGGFYEKLKEKYPELSNNELRICSLSKLRLSLKEIASMLNLSLDSIKSARYRIRKKLNLKTDQDLSDFLNTKI